MSFINLRSLRSLSPFRTRTPFHTRLHNRTLALPVFSLPRKRSLQGAESLRFLPPRRKSPTKRPKGFPKKRPIVPPKKTAGRFPVLYSCLPHQKLGGSLSLLLPGSLLRHSSLFFLLSSERFRRNSISIFPCREKPFFFCSSLFLLRI